MTPLDLITLAAASWYVAYVLVKTHGPMSIFERMREFKRGRWHGRTLQPDFFEDGKPRLHGNGINNDGLFDCIVCTMFWVAQVAAFVTGHSILDGLAVAGIALWIHSYSGWIHFGGK